MKRWTLLALLLPVIAIAATVTWQNGDGDLDTTTIQYAPCLNGDLGTPIISKTVPATTQTTQVTDGLSPGLWCFRAYHTAVDDQVSDYSNIVSVTIPEDPPDPPGDLEVGTDTRVFEIVLPEGELRLSESGTVTSGTACDTRYHVTGAYQIAGQDVEFLTVYMVPVSAVQWFGRERTTAFSLCQ